MSDSSELSPAPSSDGRPGNAHDTTSLSPPPPPLLLASLLRPHVWTVRMGDLPPEKLDLIKACIVRAHNHIGAVEARFRKLVSDVITSMLPVQNIDLDISYEFQTSQELDLGALFIANRPSLKQTPEWRVFAQWKRNQDGKAISEMAGIRWLDISIDATRRRPWRDGEQDRVLAEFAALEDRRRLPAGPRSSTSRGVGSHRSSATPAHRPICITSASSLALEIKYGPQHAVLLKLGMAQVIFYAMTGFRICGMPLFSLIVNHEIVRGVVLDVGEPADGQAEARPPVVAIEDARGTAGLGVLLSVAEYFGGLTGGRSMGSVEGSVVCNEGVIDDFILMIRRAHDVLSSQPLGDIQAIPATPRSDLYRLLSNHVRAQLESDTDIRAVAGWARPALARTKQELREQAANQTVDLTMLDVDMTATYRREDDDEEGAGGAGKQSKRGGAGLRDTRLQSKGSASATRGTDKGKKGVAKGKARSKAVDREASEGGGQVVGPSGGALGSWAAEEGGSEGVVGAVEKGGRSKDAHGGVDKGPGEIAGAEQQTLSVGDHRRQTAEWIRIMAEAEWIRIMAEERAPDSYSHEVDAPTLPQPAPECSILPEDAGDEDSDAGQRRRREMDDEEAAKEWAAFIVHLGVVIVPVDAATMNRLTIAVGCGEVSRARSVTSSDAGLASSTELVTPHGTPKGSPTRARPGGVPGLAPPGSKQATSLETGQSGQETV